MQREHRPILDSVLSSLSLAAIAVGGAILLCGIAIAVRAVFDRDWPMRLWFWMVIVGGAFTAAGAIVQIWLHQLARHYEQRPGFRVKLITGPSPVADTERETNNG